MGNGEKADDVNRDEDGYCSKSSGQVKRQADNHHVIRPAKKARRSEDELHSIIHNLYGSCSTGGAIRMDSNSSGQCKRKADDLDARDRPVLTSAVDFDFDDIDARDRPVLTSAVDFDFDDLDARDRPVLTSAVDFDFDDENGDHPVLKSAVDFDGVHETERKCDSEGSNEMAGGLISWGQCRKARCSGPFVVGSVKFKDCDGNVINCIEGKQIRFDVDTIHMIDSDNPSFTLLVEQRYVAKYLHRALFDRGYRCIIVATMRRSLDDATKTLVCKLRKMSQVFVLFDYSPHYMSMLFDLIEKDKMDLVWLGIKPSDARVLSQIAIHNLSAESAQYKTLSEISYYDYVPEPFGVPPIKSFPVDTLIHYYLPKLLSDSGVPGVEDI